MIKVMLRTGLFQRKEYEMELRPDQLLFRREGEEIAVSLPNMVEFIIMKKPDLSQSSMRNFQCIEGERILDGSFFSDQDAEKMMAALKQRGYQMETILMKDA